MHREDSPREALEIFAGLVAEEPSALLRRVAFDFPRDAAHLTATVSAAGLTVEALWEGDVVFDCRSAREVLDHLLESGAGTAFHDAIAPGARERFTRRFLDRLEERHRGEPGFPVRHEYLGCLAARP